MPLFNEANVRMFCSQVVCSVVDLLGELVDADCMEAWIELMRFLGRKLLDGFEHDRLSSTKKISINTHDRVFFML